MNEINKKLLSIIFGGIVMIGSLSWGALSSFEEVGLNMQRIRYQVMSKPEHVAFTEIPSLEEHLHEVEIPFQSPWPEDREDRLEELGNRLLDRD